MADIPLRIKQKMFSLQEAERLLGEIKPATFLEMENIEKLQMIIGNTREELMALAFNMENRR